jgi:DNA invertase Pin-like site-specific DNA recombinase
VSKGCVIYIRVSTVQQAWQSGLIRQLEQCTHFARKHDLPVYGVYADVCSGDGLMPNRTAAYTEAVKKKCRILVESLDRWSRKAFGEDPVPVDRVVVTADHAIEFEKRISRMVGEYLQAQNKKCTG